MDSIKPIAFYLPQFHPIPENDEWWGKGFTEWTNVVRARPLFKGHYQPHVPADLGFYDLRLPETREAQAELARTYGIHGFCYYHYWFNGRRLLERPFNEVLESGKPDFPFCLCWANENWTRTWDGGVTNMLIEQRYDEAAVHEHIKSLFKAFEDPRYIRINDRPLFLVYRTGSLPNPKRTAEIWRDETRKAGVGEVYLASVESVGRRTNPLETDFDAAVEFAPDFDVVRKPLNLGLPKRVLRRLGLAGKLQFDIFSYDALVAKMLAKPTPDYKRFRGVMPSWDDTPRRQHKATLWIGSTPSKYELWLKRVADQTVERFEPAERIVFINAWNEWAEGAHLEPDQRFGPAYLEATARALNVSVRTK